MMFKRLSKNKEIAKPSKKIDTSFYKELYLDLKGMNDNELINHWNKYGKKEGRFFYLKDFLDFYKIENQFLIDFDFDFYISYYEDLKSVFTAKYQAIEHYFRIGKEEKRFCNIKSLLRANAFDENVINKLQKYFNKESYKNLESINLSDINLFAFIENILKNKFRPMKIHKDDISNAKFYLLIAENYLIRDNKPLADKYLNLSLYFDITDVSLEYKGNINLDFGDYENAIGFYEAALKINNKLKFVYINLLKCYEKVGDLKSSIKLVLDEIKNMPESEMKNIEKLNSLIKIKYSNRRNNIFNNYLVSNDRNKLVEETNDLATYVYDIYFNLYGGVKKEVETNKINTNRVLIIGDYHVEQCVRYRIDQKVEQLKSQNIKVETISWTEVDAHEDKIPFYDVVIFYRVPSFVNILKTVAKVNASNKVSIYEIDDLLFDPIYPDDIRSYGGSIDLDVYNSLIMGMAKMNSIAKLCRYGIASTIPLQKKLEKIVVDKKCLLHRNGLDSLSRFETVDKSEKATIDLFYGSGTLAHNQDFIDLVLPAVIRLMNEFNNVRMIVVGHLVLPKSFLEKFKQRVVTFPKVNIKLYYNYLKQADINIAVLHKDEITDTKSELKWFEAGCFSIPSVVSGTENYLDVVKDGEDGFIAKNANEWYNNIKKLVVNKELRKTIGTKVKDRIKDEYSIEVLGKKLNTNLKNMINEDYPKASKRKKIALVNVFFPPQSIGGATRVVSDNFDVLIDSYSDEYEICVFTSEVECTEPYKMSTYNYKGVRVYKSTILYRENMDWHAEDPNMYKLFQKFLEVETPDKVHFHCVQRLTASVVEATRDMSIPYLVTVHDAWWISDHQFLVDQNDKVYPNGHPDPFYKRVLPNNVNIEMSMERESYLKGLLNDAKHCVTVSESFAKIYKKNGVPNIKVTKNGISSKIQWLQKDTSNTAKVVCGHIGGMSAHKGYDIFKKAMLNTKIQNLEVLVVDHSKDESYISNEKWGNVDVKFIGRQKQEDMVKVYGQIDVLFAPSIWPESFGLVTREASACGCWIVAGNLGGIGEDVIDGKNGFVINPSQKDLEVVLNKLNTNYKKYKNLAPKGNVSMVEEQVEKLKEYLND